MIRNACTDLGTGFARCGGGGGGGLSAVLDLEEAPGRGDS